MLRQNRKDLKKFYWAVENFAVGKGSLMNVLLDRQNKERTQLGGNGLETELRQWNGQLEIQSIYIYIFKY